MACIQEYDPFIMLIYVQATYRDISRTGELKDF